MVLFVSSQELHINLSSFLAAVQTPPVATHALTLPLSSPAVTPGAPGTPLSALVLGPSPLNPTLRPSFTSPKPGLPAPHLCASLSPSLCCFPCYGRRLAITSQSGESPAGLELSRSGFQSNSAAHSLSDLGQTLLLRDSLSPPTKRR